MPWRTAAACSAGNARSSRNAVTNCAHTKKGSRNHVMPGARSCTMVAMKFTAPKSDEMMSRNIATSHHVWPSSAKSARGGYAVQPELAAPPGTKKLASITTPPTKKAQ
jgi:hypothetical protein